MNASLKDSRGFVPALLTDLSGFSPCLPKPFLTNNSLPVSCAGVTRGWGGCLSPLVHSQAHKPAYLWNVLMLLLPQISNPHFFALICCGGEFKLGLVHCSALLLLLCKGPRTSWTVGEYNTRGIDVRWCLAVEQDVLPLDMQALWLLCIFRKAS